MPEVSADVDLVEQAVVLAAVGGQVMMSASRLRWNRERSGGVFFFNERQLLLDVLV